MLAPTQVWAFSCCMVTGVWRYLQNSNKYHKAYTFFLLCRKIIAIMFWIFLIVIIFVVFLVIKKDHNASVTKLVSNYGGMRIKYTELIDYLSQGAKINKETKDSLRLSSSSMVWNIDLIGDNVEIRMNGFMPMLGNISHKWVYPHNFSQTKMIQDIENYISWQLEELYKNIESNPKNNLNF